MANSDRWLVLNDLIRLFFLESDRIAEISLLFSP